MVVIYGLASSENGQIRYIGQTVRNPYKRLINHHSQSKRHPSRYLSKWMTSVVRDGHEVNLVILEENAIWGESEKKWIANYRQSGAKLVNGTDGGDGVLGRVWTKESREKASNASRGRKKSPEHCKAMSECRKGIRPKPESIEKQRAAMKGRMPKNLALLHELKKTAIMSQETKDKISKTLKSKGMKLSIEHKEKLRACSLAASKGRVVSEETRIKISLSLTGKKKSLTPEQKANYAKLARIKLHTPEVRKKITEALRGKKKSPESIAKRQAARIYTPWSEEERMKRSEQMRDIWKLRRAA